MFKSEHMKQKKIYCVCGGLAQTLLTFRHQASYIYIGQAYCHSPANPVHIFSQQIYLMIFFILACTISIYSPRKCHILLKVTFFWYIKYSHFTCVVF